MGRLTGWAGEPYDTLAPDDRALLDAWVNHLDVDLDLAQRMLRLPAGRLPPIPRMGEAVEVEPPVAVGLRGAYARRARKVGA